eukprot:TRINITY_DN6670_c0_g1_i1.p1 TRINITY_DN6670_c0_g1~~TRINITY_DN6670_c0_g1_i1.p1  ORF type:complete len:301 (+),score=64.24 TRINITY_DN6670_c0_g1_i1:71-973(+)
MGIKTIKEEPPHSSYPSKLLKAHLENIDTITLTKDIPYHHHFPHTTPLIITYRHTNTPTGTILEILFEIEYRRNFIKIEPYSDMSPNGIISEMSICDETVFYHAMNSVYFRTMRKSEREMDVVLGTIRSDVDVEGLDIARERNQYSVWPHKVLYHEMRDHVAVSVGIEDVVVVQGITLELCLVNCEDHSLELKCRKGKSEYVIKVLNSLVDYMEEEEEDDDVEHSYYFLSIYPFYYRILGVILDGEKSVLEIEFGKVDNDNWFSKDGDSETSTTGAPTSCDDDSQELSATFAFSSDDDDV